MPKDLHSLLDTYLADGAVGASLAYALNGATPTALTAGLADREHGVAVLPDRLFKIGSCTKTFVAAALVSSLKPASSTSVLRSPAGSRTCRARVTFRCAS